MWLDCVPHYECSAIPSWFLYTLTCYAELRKWIADFRLWKPAEEFFFSKVDWEMVVQIYERNGISVLICSFSYRFIARRKLKSKKFCRKVGDDLVFLSFSLIRPTLYSIQDENRLVLQIRRSFEVTRSFDMRHFWILRPTQFILGGVIFNVLKM